MTQFNVISTDYRDSQTLTETYTLYDDALQAFNEDLNVWRNSKQRGLCTLIELTPTQFAVYNDDGEIFYTSRINAEPSNML